MNIVQRIDPIGGSVWAYPHSSPNQPDRALVWFRGSGAVMYVLNPFVETGSWVSITNPKYDHADSANEFKQLSEDFFSLTESLR